MKLFWKIFFGIVTVTTAIFCISSHILIYAFLTFSLDNEVQNAERDNVSFGRSFLVSGQNFYNISDSYDSGEIKKIVQSIQVPQDVKIRIRDEELELLYQSESSSAVEDLNLLKSMDEQHRSYELQEVGADWFLIMADQISTGSKTYYIETIHDITHCFTQKEKQYQIYAACLIVLVFVTAFLALFLTKWITRPIRELSEAARKIGEGDYDNQIKVRGNDEIAELASTFNHMSATVKNSIEELSMAAKRQEEFVSGFSHELKTPLTSIVGYADMLRSKPLSEEEKMIYADYIFRQGKRLSLLSKKMLELTVLEKTDFQMQKIFLPNYFQLLREELRPVFEKEDIRLTWNIAEAVILGEPDLLKTVFINLLDNSRKAIGSGGEIQISARASAHTVVLTVSDNGCGIPKESLSHVTESFYMADYSRQYQNGVGLGLALCKKILDLHHATLEISSEEGSGTKVEIIFEKMQRERNR